ncbi:MAG: sll0787 family AIR synthase-like protein [Leptolyngbya sp. SIO4C1]|nr:sll0787 family AIR synthase-like protein [Leptolyngbya sp. SIO4C1]
MSDLTAALQTAVSILDKQDIQTAVAALGKTVPSSDSRPIRLGDDCAAIPDGSGYLLLAAEGMWPQLVAQSPWFAGWCAIMVNLSDIAAMGGTPVAVVDVLWSPTPEASQPLWAGMQAAATAYGISIVGGHTNCHSPYAGLAVTVLGRAEQLITSFDARPGDVLMMAINLTGQYYQDYPFWNAATGTEPAQLRAQLRQLPQLAQSRLVRAGKDISMGGIVGTLLMLAEASGCGAVLQIEQIPRPPGVAWSKWLTSFPSFGFLLSVCAAQVAQVQQHMQQHGIACEPVGEIIAENSVYLSYQGEHQRLWDMTQPLTGFGA